MSVFSNLVVPRLNIAVLPDEFLPGDLAGPVITQSTYNNPVSGKLEWIMNIRIREGELKAGFATGNPQVSFKVPVMATDDTGRLMTTINGRFKASFTAGNFSSDCGDCTMVNGQANINITLPINAFNLAANTIDTSTIQLGNDTASGCDSENSLYAKYSIVGCTQVRTSNVYPTSSAPVLEGYKYPIGDPTTFFGHIVYGDTADSVRHFRDYMSKGIYSDLKDTIINFTPFLGSGKNLIAAVNALRAQGPSIHSVATVLLATGGVVADALPVVGKAYEAYFAAYRSSVEGATQGVAKAMDETIDTSLAANRDLPGVQADLDSSFKTLTAEITTCGNACSVFAEQIDREMVANGTSNSNSMKQLSAMLESPKLNGLDIETKLSISEIALVCKNVSTLSLHTLANTGPYACALPYVDFVDQYSKSQISKGYVPKSTTYRGDLQGHHILQNEWAKVNLPGYEAGKAPVIVLETNKGGTTTGLEGLTPAERAQTLVVPRLPHTIISKLQGVRWRTRGKNYSTTIDQELQNSVNDLRFVNVSDADIRTALNSVYAMLNKLGITYNKPPGF